MHAQTATIACGLFAVGLVLGASKLGPYMTAEVVVDKELQSGAIGYEPKVIAHPLAALPVCDCSTRTTQTFIKQYAGASSNSCKQQYPDPTVKRWYREGAAEHRKTICKNGNYWTCLYDEVWYSCIPYSPRPDCPQDTCIPE